jgi:hypothetical protein
MAPARDRKLSGLYEHCPPHLRVSRQAVGASNLLDADAPAAVIAAIGFDLCWRCQCGHNDRNRLAKEGTAHLLV